MKFRTSFVSNSSTCSFIINAQDYFKDDIEEIIGETIYFLKRIDNAEMKGFDWGKDDCWRRMGGKIFESTWMKAYNRNKEKMPELDKYEEDVHQRMTPWEDRKVFVIECDNMPNILMDIIRNHFSCIEEYINEW